MNLNLKPQVYYQIVLMSTADQHIQQIMQHSRTEERYAGLL